MALGRTVVMINSRSIDCSLYDVFNRHLKILGGEMNQHYANVAIGSFSRPCPVHPDFRVSSAALGFRESVG
jgi:hypothetical protein